MKRQQQQQLRRDRRVRRVRAKLQGTAERPRLTVARSNQHIYLQAIDDAAQRTIAAASDLELQVTGTKTERSQKTAQEMAARLKKAKIEKVTFDRGAYKYHGRVKAVAETLRAEGIEV